MQANHLRQLLGGQFPFQSLPGQLHFCSRLTEHVSGSQGMAGGGRRALWRSKERKEKDSQAGVQQEGGAGELMVGSAAQIHGMQWGRLETAKLVTECSPYTKPAPRAAESSAKLR